MNEMSRATETLEHLWIKTGRESVVKKEVMWKKKKNHWSYVKRILEYYLTHLNSQRDFRMSRIAAGSIIKNDIQSDYFEGQWCVKGHFDTWLQSFTCDL